MKGRFQSIISGFKLRKKKKRKMKVVLDFEDNEDFFAPNLKK